MSPEIDTTEAPERTVEAIIADYRQPGMANIWNRDLDILIRYIRDLERRRK